MSEWNKLKARIFDLVKTSDDVPTEEQIRLYDITVGALIAEGDRLQERNKYLEDLTDNDAILLDKQNLQIQKLGVIRGIMEKCHDTGLPKYSETLVMRIIKVLDK